MDDYSASSRVIAWAAQECYRQSSGEMSVLWMLNGWSFAVERHDHLPTSNEIITLGHIVDPRVNIGNTYRTVGVSIRGNSCISWRQVSDAMHNLIENLEMLTPDEWYKEYETIHPFTDGNGRTGSILWNWIRGTIYTPEVPPDFWS